MAAPVKRLVVFGGNGFVGQRVCAEAIRRGLQVCSVSRSGDAGLPSSVKSASWAESVDWQRGDAGDPSTFEAVLDHADAVVIAIGSPPIPAQDVEWQRRVNANAAILDAVETRNDTISRLTCVSARMPQWIASGYRLGKLDMEERAREIQAGSGGVMGVTLIKPGAVYGTRHLPNGMPIPLWVVLSPISKILQVASAPAMALERALPSVFGGLLAPFADVDALGRAAVDSLLKDQYGTVITEVEASDLTSM